jgi:hypothetical protein
LRQNNYFYFDSKHLLTPETIMSTQSFQLYLKNLFNEIAGLTDVLVDERIREINNKQTKYKEYNFAAVDSNINKDNRVKLNAFGSHLYVLLTVVPSARSIINEVLRVYVNNTEYSKMMTTLWENRLKYSQERDENKSLYSTSWLSYFKSIFVSEGVNGKRQYPLSSYLRYISFYYSQAKTVNAIDQHIYKIQNQQVGEVDLVSHIFSNE